MRYIYLGDKLTRPDLVGMRCDPVKRTDGKCIVNRELATALVVDGSGRKYVVKRRRLRLLTKHYLKAMKAVAIPAAWSGLWLINKVDLPDGKLIYHEGQYIDTPPGVYTHLRCLTDATLYNVPPGDVVMEDTPHELRTHLGFVMRAYGNVLVTGLGLGCVVRGLLANTHVESVTCIENSTDVLKLVAPYMPTDRLTIIEAEALEWTAKNHDCFDCAWHDLWVNPDEDDCHLDSWHTQLIANCRPTVRYQGAWAYNRTLKRYLQRRGFCWMG